MKVIISIVGFATKFKTNIKTNKKCTNCLFKIASFFEVFNFYTNNLYFPWKDPVKLNVLSMLKEKSAKLSKFYFRSISFAQRKPKTTKKTKTKI